MKLLRITTADISLNGLLKGQLKYLKQFFEVVGVAADTGKLKTVSEREGIRVVDIPMHREISLGADLKCLWLLYRLFRKERPEIVHTNTPKGSLLSMIAAKLARVPHRLYLVTGLRYQGTNGWLRRILMTMERITCFCATKVIPDTGISKVVIIAKLSRYETLRKALNDLGVTGMTVTQVMGCGIQKGAGEKYRGVEMDATLLPKVKVEVIVSKIPVQSVIETAKKALYTGHIGDGKVFVYPVERVVKIRTGEENYDALQDVE